MMGKFTVLGSFSYWVVWPAIWPACHPCRGRIRWERPRRRLSKPPRRLPTI